jgi:hypothetical protein
MCCSHQCSTSAVGISDRGLNLRDSHLAVLVVDVAVEAEGVREALGAGALAHRHDAVLGGVEHLADLRASVEGGDEWGACVFTTGRGDVNWKGGRAS